MATTTPNFNWPVPTSTDLVKNGAVAIEALGDAVDASLLDLKGGTTGQVLAKATNTDMDFAWVAADDTNAIQNAIVDAKGDLIAATANDTPARLAVGANGETLVADSSTATGLRWQVPVNVNNCVNGGFDVWQRNTNISYTSALSPVYNSADRWWTSAAATSGATFTISRQNAVNTGSQYALRLQRNSGQTITTLNFVGTTIESANVIPLAGQTITVSAYLRRGADAPSSASNYYFQVRTGTGTDEGTSGGVNGTWTGYASNATQPAVGTTTTRFSQTITLGSTVKEIAIIFGYQSVGTAGTNEWLEVEQVQIEVGSVATPFRRSSGTIQGETSACQRYYYRNSATSNNTTMGFGFATSSTNVNGIIQFPVTMRTQPTSIDFSTLQCNDSTVGTAVSAVAFSGAEIGTQMATINLTTSGMTTFRPTKIIANGSTAGFLGFSAEL